MGLSGRKTAAYRVFTGKTSTGVSSAFFCEDFRNAVIEITVTGATPTVLVKFIGSNFDNDTNTASLTEKYPDFSAADSATNPWSYIQTVNLNDGSAIAGSTGVTLSAAGTYKFEVNVNALRWVGVSLATVTTATVDATINLYDNL